MSTVTQTFPTPTRAEALKRLHRAQSARARFEQHELPALLRQLADADAALAAARQTRDRAALAAEERGDAVKRELQQAARACHLAMSDDERDEVQALVEDLQREHFEVLARSATRAAADRAAALRQGQAAAQVLAESAEDVVGAVNKIRGRLRVPKRVAPRLDPEEVQS
jgi:hypothetical protein